jgi:thiamine-monophosphate kinase
MAEELNMDALTAALNGGEDYRLLFTIPISLHALFKKEIQTFDVIGHLTPQGNIPLLITPDDSAIPMTSTGW